MSEDRIGQYLDSNKAVTSDNLEPEAMTDQPEQSAEENLIELLERRFVTADGTIIWNDQVKGLIQSFAKQEVKKACKKQMNRMKITLVLAINEMRLGDIEKRDIRLLIKYL